jgi:hypothetical protein
MSSSAHFVISMLRGVHIVPHIPTCDFCRTKLVHPLFSLRNNSWVLISLARLAYTGAFFDRCANVSASFHGSYSLCAVARARQLWIALGMRGGPRMYSVSPQRALESHRQGGFKVCVLWVVHVHKPIVGTWLSVDRISGRAV